MYCYYSCCCLLYFCTVSGRLTVLHWHTVATIVYLWKLMLLLNMALHRMQYEVQMSGSLTWVQKHAVWLCQFSTKAQFNCHITEFTAGRSTLLAVGKFYGSLSVLALHRWKTVILFVPQYAVCRALALLVWCQLLENRRAYSYSTECLISVKLVQDGVKSCSIAAVV